MLAVVVVIGLVLLGQDGSSARQVALPSTRNVLGDPRAPVSVEEWGDFQ